MKSSTGIVMHIITQQESTKQLERNAILRGKGLVQKIIVALLRVICWWQVWGRTDAHVPCRQ